MIKIFKAFIGYKIFTLVIAVLLITYAYNKFPYMFQFMFKMLNNIK